METETNIISVNTIPLKTRTTETKKKIKEIMEEFMKSESRFAKINDVNISNAAYLNIMAKKLDMPIRAISRNKVMYLMRIDEE